MSSRGAGSALRLVRTGDVPSTSGRGPGRSSKLPSLARREGTMPSARGFWLWGSTTAMEWNESLLHAGEADSAPLASRAVARVVVGPHRRKAAGRPILTSVRLRQIISGESAKIFQDFSSSTRINYRSHGDGVPPVGGERVLRDAPARGGVASELLPNLPLDRPADHLGDQASRDRFGASSPPCGCPASPAAPDVPQVGAVAATCAFNTRPC